MTTAVGVLVNIPFSNQLVFGLSPDTAVALLGAAVLVAASAQQVHRLVRGHLARRRVDRAMTAWAIEPHVAEAVAVAAPANDTDQAAQGRSVAAL